MFINKLGSYMFHTVQKAELYDTLLCLKQASKHLLSVAYTRASTLVSTSYLDVLHISKEVRKGEEVKQRTHL